MAGGANEARDGDEVAFGQVDGAVGVELGKGRCTSQRESWMEEWSLEAMILSV